MAPEAATEAAPERFRSDEELRDLGARPGQPQLVEACQTLPILEQEGEPAPDALRRIVSSTRQASMNPGAQPQNAFERSARSLRRAASPPVARRITGSGSTRLAARLVQPT